MRLTDLQIKRLSAPERGQKTYFDEALRGFGVRVSQGGSKSFVVMYGASRKLKTIGRYPKWSLAEARREAKRIQSTVTELNPSDIPTLGFNEAKERFLADSQARNKPRTYEEYRRLLDRHFSFSKSLGEISRRDIMGVIERLQQTPSEAHHAYVAIRTMMNWCDKHGLIEHSPVPRRTFQATARTRVLTDDELKLVWHRAEAFGYPYGTIVQLLILTGQRRGEIAGLKRSWIEDDLITYPAGFTKNRREHRLPIGNRTQQIIGQIAMLVGDDGDPVDLLFPSRFNSDRPFNGWPKAKRQFDVPLQFAPYTLHDLRRTYSSNMARLGVPIHVTEKLLNHVSGTLSGIAAVYNRHTYLPEMRDAVELYERHLETLIKA